MPELLDECLGQRGIEDIRRTMGLADDYSDLPTYVLEQIYYDYEEGCVEQRAAGVELARRGVVHA
jgi:5-methylthioribose kinase